MGKSVEDVKKEISDDIEKLEEVYKTYRKDGITLSEIAKFAFELGIKMIIVVERVSGIKGELKKEVVLDTVRTFYKKHDPDIPWLIEPFETMVEDLFLDKALGAFIDVTVGTLNEKGVM